MERGKVLIIIGLLLMLIGGVFHIVGLSTTQWTKLSHPKTERGPYRFCQESRCGETAGGDGNQDCVRAMTIIGSLFFFFGSIAYCLLLVYPDSRRYLLAGIVLSALSFITILIGIIVWGAGVHGDIRSHQERFNKEEPDLGYSFVLSLVGGILIMLGGLIAYLGGRWYVKEVYAV